MSRNLQAQAQSLLAQLYDGSLSLGCTAHFGQTAEVKRRLCLAANYARRLVVSAEIYHEGCPVIVFGLSLQPKNEGRFIFS